MPVYPAPQPAPSQRTWAAGEYPTAAQFNTYFRDGIGFLQNPPACRVFNSAALSIPHNSVTILTFDSERFDTDNMHSTSVNTSRITMNTGGLYTVNAGVAFNNNATGVRFLALLHNAATYIAIQGTNAENGDNTYLNITSTYKFAAGDYVVCQVFQTCGGALNINTSPNWSPEFSAVWVGIG